MWATDKWQWNWPNWVIAAVFIVSVVCLVAAVLLWLWDAFRLAQSSWKTRVKKESIVRSGAQKTKTLEPKQRDWADRSKVEFIDQIYPVISDLAEIFLDRLGNKTNEWKTRLVNGDHEAYFKEVRAERDKVVRKYHEITPLLDRNQLYDDIVYPVRMIGNKLSELGSAQNTFEKKTTILSGPIGEGELELLYPFIDDATSKVGKARQYIKKECLDVFANIRRDETSRR